STPRDHERCSASGPPLLRKNKAAAALPEQDGRRQIVYGAFAWSRASYSSADRVPLPSVSAAAKASGVRSGQATCASVKEIAVSMSASTEAKSVGTAACARAALVRPRAIIDVSNVFFMGFSMLRAFIQCPFEALAGLS